jgi:hypothetical protein
MRKSRPADGFIERAGRVAAVVLGMFIVITSAAGIALGLRAEEGWLAIIYGGLGVSMGVAGVVVSWTKGALRGSLLGWFLIGLASRAVAVGDIFLLVIGIPVAAALVLVLTLALLRQRSGAVAAGAVAAGILAILALVVLAAVAPSLPAICIPIPASGTSQGLILYPANAPPFDFAEQSYDLHCLEQT